MPQIVFYGTSCAATLKTRTDISKILHILDAKKVQYENVDLTLQPQRRQDMLAGSDGVKALPQLHIDGKLVGHAEEVQELEDWGELDYLLRGEPIPTPPGLQPAAEEAPWEDSLPEPAAAALAAAAAPSAEPSDEEEAEELAPSDASGDQPGEEQAAATDADAAAPEEEASEAAPEPEAAAEPPGPPEAEEAPEPAGVWVLVEEEEEEAAGAEAAAEPAEPAPESAAPGGGREAAAEAQSAAAPAPAEHGEGADGCITGQEEPCPEAPGSPEAAPSSGTEAAPADWSAAGPEPATPGASTSPPAAEPVVKGAACTPAASPWAEVEACPAATSVSALVPEELSRATPEAVRRWLAPADF